MADSVPCRRLLVAFLTDTSRYVYVPLGGSNNVIVATLVSFTFVALWHDLRLRLLAWGWLVTIFILPEMVLGQVVSEKKVRVLPFFNYASDTYPSSETCGGTDMLVP